MLLTNDLYQNAFAPPAVKLAIEDLFPRAEIQLPVGDGHHHLSAHDLTFHVRIRIVLTRVIVAVLTDGFMGRQLLQPLLIVLMQAPLVVVYQKKIVVGRRDGCP